MVSPASLACEKALVSVEWYSSNCWIGRLMMRIDVQIHPSTLDWLQDRFSVSTIFLESIINIRNGVIGKLGNACFVRRNERGRVIAIGLSLLPP
jgi:hypothetical protein